MIEKLKKLKRVLARKDFFHNYQVKKVIKQRFGSKYGGWWIIPGYINDKSIIVSAGLGEDISFDIELMEEFNCFVYGLDPTPKSIKYIKSQDINGKFNLLQFALFNENKKLTFNLPLNDDHVSGSIESISSDTNMEVEAKTLKTLCKELNINSIDILKMDIEGSEYHVIENMISNNIYPKQILIEYHHFFDSLTNNDTRNSINLLLSNDYELFHIEAYNYCFVRN